MERYKWIVTPAASGKIGVRNSNGFVCFMAEPTRFPGQEQRYSEEIAEMAKDARLIAAAPALLDACKAAHIAMVALGNDVNWNGIPQSYADAINALRAAIAQAEVQDGQ